MSRDARWIEEVRAMVVDELREPQPVAATMIDEAYPICSIEELAALVRRACERGEADLEELKPSTRKHLGIVLEGEA